MGLFRQSFRVVDALSLGRCDDNLPERGAGWQPVSSALNLLSIAGGALKQKRSANKRNSC
jgi:hypothetical protein